MPGILPMKVIKVGNGSQSRIAQACDRCRSKKIRCDGVRPCCTQCANVGFECKTSDKLSRRAFPRGYTESLEERVRALEAEVRDLKSLLDEKDEKIDVLSRLHSFSPPSQRMASSQSPPASTSEAKLLKQSDNSEGVIQVRPSSSQQMNRSPDVPLTGLSSTLRFMDLFTERVLDQGNLSANISTRALTAQPPVVSHARVEEAIKTPPRLVSDQLINIFFQEWAPLYPVVHRPTILKAYEQYLTNSDFLRGNSHIMAQLNLIFGIAALASTTRTNQDPTYFEENWSSTLESLSSEISVSTLQCFVLAEIYCMAKGDYRSLLRYRGLATGICHQLGLHQSQKRFSLNPLALETRKKVFWCQYALDRFTAALTGLPVLLREEDVQTEYPVDVDDENVTETGFLPTLPGESTRLSSAIALFGASRILNKALEVLYPSEMGYEISVSKMRSVTEELDEWLNNLPAHLKLEFSQDKPSTNVTSSRSPLLSLVYYFIRSLVHRPAVCFAEANMSSPSTLALSDSSKHIIQILELLDERRLCLSVCINRKELVLLSGLGLLWQITGLKRDGKLVKESQKLLTAIIDQLESESAPAAAEFSVIANLLVSVEGGKGAKLSPAMPAPSQKAKSPKRQLQSWKQRLSTSGASGQPQKSESPSRRNTISGASPPLAPRHHRSPSRSSLPSSEPRDVNTSQSRPVDIASGHHGSFPMGYDSARALSCSALTEPANGAITMADWEFVLGDMDRGYSNIFTGIYGGKECGEDSGPFASLTAEYHQKHEDIPVPLSLQQNDYPQELSPEAWSSSSGDFPPNREIKTQSVLSYSEDSMTSAEDAIPFGDMQLHQDDHAGLLDPFRGIIIPAAEDEIDDFGLVDGWDRRLAV